MTTEYSKLMSRQVPTLELSVPSRPGAECDLAFDMASGFDQVVGRDASADIMVPDPTMSRQHARIAHDPGGVWLEDLGSTNGTYVNGHRLLDRYRLRDGDEVRLGNTIAIFHDAIRAPDATDLHEVLHDVMSAPDPMELDETITGVPGVPCPRCSTRLGSDSWFCHQCGYQQWPMEMQQGAPAARADVTRQKLIGPHGNIRSRPFSQLMRARNGGRRPLYNESVAVPALLFRVLLVLALIVAVVASAVVLGLGVHHFVQLREQSGRRSVAGHARSFVPIRFHARVR